MRGLYIPDVSLPEEDFELWIAVKKDGSFTYNVNGNWHNGKQKAIPIPPYGKLINEEALSVYMTAPLNSKSYKYVPIDNISTTSTIIPTDKEDET